MVTFKEKSFHFYIIGFIRRYVNSSHINFKRVASSHEKLHNEQGRSFCFYVTSYYDLLVAHL